LTSNGDVDPLAACPSKWNVVRRGLIAGVVAVVLVLTGCGSSSKPKGSARAASGGDAFFAPAPSAGKVLSLVEAAGLEAETAERLEHHVHAHLDIYVNGTHKLVPAAIGIVITDPQVHHARVEGFDQYGGISKPCADPCISPLHTHDVTGTLHTESATAEDNTLGQFFKEWDVTLDANCVGTYCAPDTPIMVYVDGEPVALDKAAEIALTDQTEIAIVIGKAPAKVPSTPDFGT
jgi:hypothetical protein